MHRCGKQEVQKMEFASLLQSGFLGVENKPYLKKFTVELEFPHQVL